MIKTRLKQMILFGGDVVFLVFSLYIALAIRYWQIPDAGMWHDNNHAFLMVYAIWLWLFYLNNLYNFQQLTSSRKFLTNFWRSLLIGFAAAVAYFYLFPQAEATPKTNLLIFSLTFCGLFLSWRLFILKIFRKHLPKINLGIIGQDKNVEELIAEINKNPHLGYEVKFTLGAGSENNLEELIAKNKINILILENNPANDPALQKKLFNCLPLKITYTTLANFYENLTGRVPLEIINENWFLENLNLHHKNIYEYLKRLNDVVLAGILLILSLPFYLLIAVSIKIDSRGPIIFKQIRLGQNHIPFTILKFRTMTVENNDASFTTENDKRITRLGKFLRKTRLDEIPQLINIVKGEMSFIGPRPERPEFIANLEKDIPFYAIRSLSKPGISGWDQVSGEYHSASTADTFKKLQYDIYYIKNRSISLDLIIIAKTIKTVLAYRGR